MTAHDLEKFKKDYQSSVYTCRLGSCARATVGFETERQRDEHEIGHVRQFRCTYSSCQYPPFLSAQALRRHVNGTHQLMSPKRKPIRQSKDARGPSQAGQHSGTAAGSPIPFRPLDPPPPFHSQRMASTRFEAALGLSDVPGTLVLDKLEVGTHY